MKNNKALLCSILKTAQMGQVGIRSVMRASMLPGLRTELESQLSQYDTIESEALGIAAQRGWELPQLNPMARTMADSMARMRLFPRSSDSEIADMMIRGNTKGMIKGLKDLHRFPSRDSLVCTLSQKLLDCEKAGIDQMQRFL